MVRSLRHGSGFARGVSDFDWEGALGHNSTTVVWYRLDLRIDDHRPLVYAAKRGRVVPVYVWDTCSGSESGGAPSESLAIGGASRWWLHQSLQALSESLEGLGSALILRAGDPLEVLRELCEEVGADQVVIHESTDPISQALEDSLDDQLDKSNIELVRFPADLLWSVGSVMSGSAKPYQVFTPFWNRASSLDVDEPVDSPSMLSPPACGLGEVSLNSLGLIDTVDWASGFRSRWTPGEANAAEIFRQFLTEGIDEYHLTRNQLNEPGWSAMSAPIHFGEISVRRMWHAIKNMPGSDQNEGAAGYLRQLGWHDFAIHIMNHFPHTIHEPFRDQFNRFPWVMNEEHWSRWKSGLTGYPVVDAAMRNLWTEGWMPNRARMIVASFLCKHLLISWKDGADWFWDTLVDADLAKNMFGWQWTAGCGADAAPYFRIFNPITQGKKFDPDGAYVRRWVPELALLPGSMIHTPWEVDEEELRGLGVTLGVHYPRPIVDHAHARATALEAFAKMK